MVEELIRILQEQAAEGAEVVAFTIVLKKNYTAYAVTTDTWGKEVYITEVV